FTLSFAEELDSSNAQCATTQHLKLLVTLNGRLRSVGTPCSSLLNVQTFKRSDVPTSIRSYLLYFQLHPHSFAQRRASIPFLFLHFRTLFHPTDGVSFLPPQNRGTT